MAERRSLPDTEVREARDRVRAATQTAQFEFPQRKVTVNLAPADLPKESGRYDLPIALGILAATGQIPGKALDGYEFAGEVALSVQRDGRAFVLPSASAAKAAMVKGAIVYGAGSLLTVCPPLPPLPPTASPTCPTCAASRTRSAHWRSPRPARTRC